MRKVLRAVCLAAVLVLLQGCMSSSEREKAQVARAVVALEHEQDADSLAAAALLSSSWIFTKDQERASLLIARATAAAPDRADLAWLQVRICQEAPPCDAQPFEDRVRALDPSNGVAWLGALARSWAAKDDPGTNEALRAIGQTDRVDLYYTGLIARLTPRVAQAGSISLNEAAVAVIGILAADIIPAYQSASRACNGERLSQTEVVSLCQGLAGAFENGDTLITEMVGVAIAKRVWPQNSPQWQAAVDARQLYEYQSKLLMDLPQLTDVASTERYLSLCGQYRREHDVLRAQLVEAGKNPDPPEPSPGKRNQSAGGSR